MENDQNHNPEIQPDPSLLPNNQPSLNQPQVIQAQYTDTQPKKHKTLPYVLILLAVILLAGGVFAYWYFHQDHSVYAKLTSENYSQNGVAFSFEYPAIVKPDSALLGGLQYEAGYNNPISSELLANEYKTSNNQKIVITAGTQKISGILNQYKLSSAQFLYQIKSGTGNFANALKQADPSVFQTLYDGCDTYITNMNHQTLLRCYSDSNGSVGVQIVGADSNFEYNFQVIVPDSIWSSHQKVWQKVQESFTY